jgi:hypothetical protein
MTRTRLSLAFGGAAWLLVMAAYAFGLITQGQENVAIGLAYNAPIALLFLVLAAEIAIYFLAHGVRRTLADRGLMLALWVFGCLILFLRLVTPKIEVSGHMTWLPLLSAQSFVLRFPAWLTVLGLAATMFAAWLKFAVFRGPSGGPGLLIGIGLALLLMIVSRRGSRGARYA